MDWKCRETITQHRKKEFQKKLNLRAQFLKLALIRDWPEQKPFEELKD